MLLCWFIIYSSYIDRKSQRKYSWKKIKRALGKQEVKHCAFSKRVEILFPYYWYLNWGKRGCISLSKCSIIPLNIKALTNLIWLQHSHSKHEHWHMNTCLDLSGFGLASSLHCLWSWCCPFRREELGKEQIKLVVKSR